MSTINSGLERDLQVFIDPDISMSQDAAYGIVADVWDELDLGYAMLEPPEQAQQEQVTLAPGSIGQIASRAIAAPRLGWAGRQAFADRVQAMVPGEFGQYGGLWRPYGSEGFSLGHQTADNKLVSGEAYEEALVNDGQAVKGSDPDSPVWVFDGATDVQVHGRQTSGTLGKVFSETVRPTATVETHMLILAIHRFAKIPRPNVNHPQIIDAVNEAVCTPSDDSILVPKALAVVGWNSNRQLISVGYRPMDNHSGTDVRVR